MIQMWSCASTDTPIVDPRTQWLGSGFGHRGSTSKRGACTVARDCAAAVDARDTTMGIDSRAPPTAMAKAAFQAVLRCIVASVRRALPKVQASNFELQSKCKVN